MGQCVGQHLGAVWAWCVRRCVPWPVSSHTANVSLPVAGHIKTIPHLCAHAAGRAGAVPSGPAAQEDEESDLHEQQVRCLSPVAEPVHVYDPDPC